MRKSSCNGCITGQDLQLLSSLVVIHVARLPISNQYSFLPQVKAMTERVNFMEASEERYKLQLHEANEAASQVVTVVTD